MTSLDTIVEALSRNPELWWGYAEEHGWLVSIAAMRNDGDSRQLIRCRDWVQIEVSRADFGSEKFKGFKKHIGSLATTRHAKPATICFQFTSNYPKESLDYRVTKEELAKRRQEAERNLILEAHRKFLESQGLPPQSIRSPTDRPHRITHCYACKHHLDNAVRC